MSKYGKLKVNGLHSDLPPVREISKPASGIFSHFLPYPVFSAHAVKVVVVNVESLIPTAVSSVVDLGLTALLNLLQLQKVIFYLLVYFL